MLHRFHQKCCNQCAHPFFDFAPPFTTVYLSKINVYIIKESSLMPCRACANMIIFVIRVSLATKLFKEDFNVSCIVSREFSFIAYY